MKLKRGNAVSVSELTNENYIKILDAFKNSGASVGEEFYRNGIIYVKYRKFLEFYEGRLVKTDSIENHNMLISVDEILGENNKVSNDWFEKGELPPVGTECQVRETTSISVTHKEWSKIKVLAHNIGSDGEHQVVCIDRHGDCAIFYVEPDGVQFRPLKSDREKAIEEMIEVMSKTNGSTYGSCAKKLYDAGYRKVENKNE